MQKYKAIKTEYGYLIIKDKKSNNYLTALYYDGKEVVASSHEIYSRLPSFDVPEEWEDDVEISNAFSINKNCCCHHCWIGFKEGYNKHAEKYKWTDEDMGKVATGMIRYILDNLGKGDADTEQKFEEILQSLSKPKEYEVDIEFVNNKVIIKSWKEIN